MPSKNPAGRLGDLTLLTLVLGLAFPGLLPAKDASVVSIAPEDLVEYPTEAPEVKKLIEVSLALTRKKLSYQFGSNSPEKGGMDCSGTVQSALSRSGLQDLPRSSYDFYLWAKEEEGFVATPQAKDADDAVFENLRPGDLLFWKGTYRTKERDPAISHVMIYLGTLKADGEAVVFGASDGRRYRGKRIHGVSVFDFALPGEESSSVFVGYGPVPGLRNGAPPPAKGENKGLKSLLENLVKKSEVSPP